MFSKNRMVGELSKDETETLALIRGTDKGYLTIPIEKNQHVAFSNVRTTTKITPDMSPGNSLAFTVHVDIQGVLMETFPHRNISWQTKKEIERKAERLIKRDIEKLISKLQGLDTDPLEFGGKVRVAYPREWKDIDWKQVYPNADIEVETDFTIKETGLFR